MAITPDHIRNIGIFAHVDAGKTTVTEQMLFRCGVIRAAGSVDAGTAQTDFLSVERERGLSVRCSQVSFTHRGETVNLIDTPGHVDFSGEAERSLTVLDGAVLVISAVEGIQSYTESLWDAVCRLGLPCLIFINKIDRAGSDYAARLADLAAQFPARRFVAFSSVSGEQSRDCRVTPVTDDALWEVAADYDDAVAESFLGGGPCPVPLVRAALIDAVRSAKLVPVLAGASLFGIGIGELLDAVTEFLPTADAAAGSGETSALIYQIEHDKTMGKLAHVRLYSGSLSSREAVHLITPADRSRTVIGHLPEEETPGEKISQIRKYNGARYTDVGQLTAGDIGVLCGLPSARVGDWIGRLPERQSEAVRLAYPCFSVKASPERDEELTALVAALRELCDEDPLLDCKWEKTEREIRVSITGRIQLEVLSALLWERYHLKASFSPPTVIYRETPARAGFGYEAYTMPKPCWAVVRLLIEPLPRGAGVVYDGGQVPSNRLFYKYQSHIRTSFFSSLEQGLCGWEVTDFKATLADGAHHVQHTHPLDFFVATPMAFMNGLVNCGTLLLEPYQRVRVTADADCLGRIISDVTRMRGTFDDPVITRTRMTIEARLPVADSMDWPVRLASLTGGRAVYRSVFDGYSECPPDFCAKTPRRGINPLDRAKWILAARGAIQEDIL